MITPFDTCNLKKILSINRVKKYFTVNYQLCIMTSFRNGSESGIAKLGFNYVDLNIAR